MQGSGRLLVSSARRTAALRRTHTPAGRAIRTVFPSPPLSFLVDSTGVQRRGYRRTAASLKDDDDRRSKSGKDVENKPPEDKPSKEVESAANEQDAKLVDSAQEPKESEASGHKEKRTKDAKHQKSSEESVRPAIISRNQALSLVTNNGNKSRLIIASHDHPDVYPQCMALAMSGRPILPGFYSTLSCR